MLRCMQLFAIFGPQDMQPLQRQVLYLAAQCSLLSPAAHSLIADCQQRI